MSLTTSLRRLFGGSDGNDTLRPTVNGPRALELVRGGAALIDVRENSEWKSGHAPQALHVPLAAIDTAPRRLSKDTPVVVMCASGMRSRTAAKHLRKLGFEATSLSGGIGAWQAAGGSVRR